MRYIAIGALIVVALVSAFPLREISSSPSTYEGIIATLDEKRGQCRGNGGDVNGGIGGNLAHSRRCGDTSGTEVDGHKFESHDRACCYLS